MLINLIKITVSPILINEPDQTSTYATKLLIGIMDINNKIIEIAELVQAI